MSIFGEFGRAAAGRTLARAAASGAAALALLGCGGGEQLVAFAPQRILALGDETSVITAAGAKYTVNALDTTLTALDCAANPMWAQYVASGYGIVFPECNRAGVTTSSRILAQPGAKVSDPVCGASDTACSLLPRTSLTAQVDRQFAAGGFAATDLVTVLVGGNDVLEQYRRFPTASAAEITAAVEAAGDALAVQVNRIAAAGGKVLLAKVLDLGQTPYGLAEQAANTDTDRSALLTNLAARFNARLRVGIVNDGRRIGLVQSDERLQTIVRFPSSFGFTNVTLAACLSSVIAPACTTQTLGTDASGGAASGSTWLWADSLNLSAGGHQQLGEIGLAVARNNPF